MRLSNLSIWADGGLQSAHPHQTRRAIESALRVGVHGITLYVRTCRTGELVLLQDETIDALAFGRVHAGFVKYSSLEDLKKIDFGGEPVMTLSCALRLIKGQIKTNVVLCSEDGLPALVDTFKNMAEDLRIPYSSMMFSSHDQHQIKKFSSLLPRVETGVVMSGIPLNYLDSLAELQCQHVFLDAKSAREKMIRDAEFRGIKVFVQGNLSKEELSLLSELGISGIVTACPQLFIDQSEDPQKEIAVA